MNTSHNSVENCKMNNIIRIPGRKLRNHSKESWVGEVEQYTACGGQTADI
jgi:hypothetical protein